MADYQGTEGDDTFFGDWEINYFDLTDGGSDTAYGNRYDDHFMFGATFDETDRVDGGDLNQLNQLVLEGDYSRRLTMNGTMVKNISVVFLGGSYEYNLKLAGDLVAPDQWIGFTASAFDKATITLDATDAIGGVAFGSGMSTARFFGGTGQDSLNLSQGARVRFDGGAGLNTLTFGTATRGVTVDLSLSDVFQNTRNGVVSLTNVSSVYGTRFADRLMGDDQNNFIVGYGGRDRIAARGGDDYIFLAPGISSAADAETRITVDGGDGNDIVSFFATHYQRIGVVVDLNVRRAQDTNYGSIIFRSVENITGTLRNDTLTGDRNANILLGNEGADVLSGGGGDDILHGDAYGIFDRDEMRLAVTPVLDDALADTLDGGNGDDWIDGGGGDDIIIGGRGADILIGGAGNDLFVYNDIKDSTAHKADTIRDFETGDRIDLSAIDSDLATPGDQAFHLGRTEGRAGDIVVDYLGDNDQTRIRLYVDGDARPDGLIYLDGRVTLTEANFNF